MMALKYILLGAVLALLCSVMAVAQDRAEAAEPKSVSKSRAVTEVEKTLFNSADVADISRKLKDYTLQRTLKCISWSGHRACYHVYKPIKWSWIDNDCCCPTRYYYYCPKYLYFTGSWWYPYIHWPNHWQCIKVGICAHYNYTCNVDKTVCPWKKRKCTQQYNYYGFLFWHWTKYGIHYHWLRIPHTCSCRHCPYCPFSVG